MGLVQPKVDKGRLVITAAFRNESNGVARVLVYRHLLKSLGLTRG